MNNVTLINASVALPPTHTAPPPPPSRPLRPPFKQIKKIYLSASIEGMDKVMNFPFMHSTPVPSDWPSVLCIKGNKLTQSCVSFACLCQRPNQGPYAPQGSRKLRKRSRRSKSVLQTLIRTSQVRYSRSIGEVNSNRVTSSLLRKWTRLPTDAYEVRALTFEVSENFGSSDVLPCGAYGPRLLNCLRR